MKFKLLLPIFIFSFLLGACQMFSDDPPPKPEYHNFKGLWKGSWDTLPNHKKFDIEINIITQGQFGNVTGIWKVDFVDSKVNGTLLGTTRKDGVGFGLKVANSRCELSFRGEEENNVIRGVLRSFQPKECSSLKFSEGSLVLQRQKN